MTVGSSQGQLSSHLVPSVNPNIYSIYELLDLEGGSGLQNQIQKHVISTKVENLKHGCGQRSLSDGPVCMVLQRTEALSQTNDSWH